MAYVIIVGRKISGLRVVFVGGGWAIRVVTGVIFWAVGVGPRVLFKKVQ